MDWTRVCFVVSPIGQRGTEHFEIFRRVLDTLIRPAVERSPLRLRVVRADDIFRPGSFIRDVVEYIAKSHTVIADLTGQNANVFYELGVRHALSPRTILIARSEADVPADLREYRTLIYGSMSGDEAELQQILRRYLTEIERAPDAPDNPVLSWLEIPRVPDDLRQTFAARLAGIGRTQADILRFMQQSTRSVGAHVTQSEIAAKFGRNDSEAYYRLEQLRLLGFVSKEPDPARGSAHVYRLTAEYRRELGFVNEPPNPELSVLNVRGTKESFGRGPGAPPAYFFHLQVKNSQNVRLERAVVAIKRIRRMAADGSILDDYSTSMPLKWRYGADLDRGRAQDLEASSVNIVSFGYAVRDYGFFQLDIAQDPWPAGFPARLDPGQRLRVDMLTEGPDVFDSEPLSIEVAWDGVWRDDPAEMQKHLTVNVVRSG